MEWQEGAEAGFTLGESEEADLRVSRTSKRTLRMRLGMAADAIYDKVCR